MTGAVRLGRWKLRAFADLTRSLFAKVERGGAEECGCDACENFIAVRDRTYPREFLQALAGLGIDPRKDAEVVHYVRLPNGLHSYGGWFHAVAEIEEGADAWVGLPAGGHTLQLEPLSKGFAFGVSGRVALVHAAFAGRPLVQVEFATEAPWVVAKAEPA